MGGGSEKNNKTRPSNYDLSGQVTSMKNMHNRLESNIIKKKFKETLHNENNQTYSN